MIIEKLSITAYVKTPDVFGKRTPRAIGSIQSSSNVTAVSNVTREKRNAGSTAPRSLDSPEVVETIARLDVAPAPRLAFAAMTPRRLTQRTDIAGCNERSGRVHRELISKHVYPTLILDLSTESVYTCGLLSPVICTVHCTTGAQRYALKSPVWAQNANVYVRFGKRTG